MRLFRGDFNLGCLAQYGKGKDGKFDPERITNRYGLNWTYKVQILTVFRHA